MSGFNFIQAKGLDFICVSRFHPCASKDFILILKGSNPNVTFLSALRFLPKIDNLNDSFYGWFKGFFEPAVFAILFLLTR
jgi:hypothetical protein